MQNHAAPPGATAVQASSANNHPDNFYEEQQDYSGSPSGYSSAFGHPSNVHNNSNNGPASSKDGVLGQPLFGMDAEEMTRSSNHNHSVNASSSSASSPTKRHIPIVYKISMHATSRAFSITILLPKHRMTQIESCPFGDPINHNNDDDPNRVRISLSNLFSRSSTSNASISSWLDTHALGARLSTGGEAIGMSPAQCSNVHSIVQILAQYLASGWCPPGTDAMQVDLVLLEDYVVLQSLPINPQAQQQQQQQPSAQQMLPPEFRMASTPGSSSNLLPPSNTTIGSGGVTNIWNGESSSSFKEESFLPNGPFHPNHPNNNNINNTNFSMMSRRASVSTIGTSGSELLPPPNHVPALANPTNPRGFQRSFSMTSHNSSSSPSTPIGSIASSYGGGGGGGGGGSVGGNNSMFSSPRGSPYSNWYPGTGGGGGGGPSAGGSENGGHSRNFLEPHQNQQNQFRPPMNPGSSPSHTMLSPQQQQRSSPSNTMTNAMGGNAPLPWNASPKSFASSITTPGAGSPPRIWSRAKSVDTGMATPPPPTMMNAPPARSSPDPMQIVEPLKAMGFSQRQCDVAVQAIRKLSLEEDSSHSNNASLPFRSTSQGSYTNTNTSHDGSGTEERGYANGKERETRSDVQNGNDNQLTGEDILDYVLSSSDNQQTSGRLLEQDRNNKIHTINSDMAKMENTMRNLLANSDGSKENPSRENRVWEMTSSSHMQSSLQQDGQQGISNMHTQSSVWGNAGKLKAVKSSLTASGGSNSHDPNSVSEESIPDSGSSGGNHYWANSGYTPQDQQQNVMKMLNIPSDLNAFVFHCNSNTREECLQRGLFG